MLKFVVTCMALAMASPAAAASGDGELRKLQEGWLCRALAKIYKAAPKPLQRGKLSYPIPLFDGGELPGYALMVFKVSAEGRAVDAWALCEIPRGMGVADAAGYYLGTTVFQPNKAGTYGFVARFQMKDGPPDAPVDLP